MLIFTRRAFGQKRKVDEDDEDKGEGCKLAYRAPTLYRLTLGSASGFQKGSDGNFAHVRTGAKSCQESSID